MRAFRPIQTIGDLVSRVVRILAVGLIVGICTSLAALAMVWLINTASDWILLTKNTTPGLIAGLLTICIPVLGGLIVGHIVQHMTDARPHNPADVILAAQSDLKLASLKAKDGILNYVASIISLACGASLGQYGPIVNMGATLSANLYKITRTDHTVLIGCGVAAAISSAFSAPIAGVIFAHEVILRHYSLRAFAPITIASSVGFYISKFVFFSAPLFEIEYIQILFLGEFMGFTMVGIVSGLVAVAFLRSVLYARLLSNRIPLQQKYKPHDRRLVYWVACATNSRNTGYWRLGTETNTILHPRFGFVPQYVVACQVCRRCDLSWLWVCGRGFQSIVIDWYPIRHFIRNGC